MVSQAVAVPGGEMLSISRVSRVRESCELGVIFKRQLKGKRPPKERLLQKTKGEM